jgi:cell division septal protein FtsQ
MAATTAATLATASAGSASRPDPIALRSNLSAALLLCRFGTVAALLLAAASVPQSSFFTITDIRIEGARRIAPSDLQARTGLRLGAASFGVSPDDVARRVAAHPRIRTVAVGITPAGRVTIRVAERSAAAAIRYQDRFVEVDPAGVAIAERADPGDLPVIATGAGELPWIRLGTAVPSSAVPASIEALAQLPAALPRAGLTLRRSPGGDLTMVTSDRIVVRLGSSRGLADRTAMLPEILAALRGRRLAVDYVDLRFAGSVVVKPAADGAGAGVKP